VITVQDLELRAGARLLMDQVSFRIDKGDKIGLVGRNGAGKTTLTRVLAGEGLPAAGKVTRTGEIGYLPQDPRTPDMEQLARDRILAARGLDIAVSKLRLAHDEMASEDAEVQRKAMNRYDRLESEFLAAGGYSAEAEAAAICSNLALPDRILNQPLKTLSGGQRRRVELARILYSDAETMLLDEPTNHLDADSIAWLREFLKNHQGGLIVISHDTELLEATVNKVFLLDANRAQIDFYNMDWKRYLLQRETDERARKRERANAEKKAQVLFDQANKMRAKRHQGCRSTEHGQACRTPAQRPGSSPRERPCGSPAIPRPVTLRQDPAHRRRPQQVLRFSGNLHGRGPRDRPRLQGGHPGPQRRRQDHPPADARRCGQA